MSHPEHIIVVGNPGTGKSTMLNILTQKRLFRAGDSLDGTGVTTELVTHEHEGKKYTDTPGLSDVARRTQAASAITAALRLAGSYKVIFFVRLEAGRIHNEDCQTVNAVLSSIKISDLPFGIIMNKIDEPLYTKLKQEGGLNNHLATLRSALMGRNPQKVLVLPRITELTGEQTAIVARYTPELKSFIAGLTPTIILADQVHEVNTDDWDAEKERLKDCIKALEGNAEALEKRMKVIIEENAHQQRVLQERQAQDIAKLKAEMTEKEAAAENNDQEAKARLVSLQSQLDEAQNRQKKGHSSELPALVVGCDNCNFVGKLRSEIGICPICGSFKLHPDA